MSGHVEDLSGDCQPEDDLSVSLPAPVKTERHLFCCSGDLQPEDDKSDDDLDYSRCQRGEGHLNNQVIDQTNQFAEDIPKINQFRGGDCSPGEVGAGNDEGHHSRLNGDQGKKEGQDGLQFDMEIIEVDDHLLRDLDLDSAKIREVVKSFTEKRLSLNKKSKLPGRLASVFEAAGAAIAEVYKFAAKGEHHMKAGRELPVKICM